MTTNSSLRHALDADYQLTGLTQYDDNPLILALPPIRDEEQAAIALTRTVEFKEAERNLPTHLRQHALLPIFQFFQPLSHHLALEAKIASMLRFGYVHRNPTNPMYFQNNRKQADAMATQTDEAETTNCSSLIGTSGTGKTTAVNRILGLYPKAIKHKEYNGKAFDHLQLVWLKLECPFDGSVKALCCNFFVTVRRRRLTVRGAGVAGWRGETTILSNSPNPTPPHLQRES